MERRLGRPVWRGRGREVWCGCGREVWCGCRREVWCGCVREVCCGSGVDVTGVINLMEFTISVLIWQGVLSRNPNAFFAACTKGGLVTAFVNTVFY